MPEGKSGPPRKVSEGGNRQVNGKEGKKVHGLELDEHKRVPSLGKVSGWGGGKVTTSTGEGKRFLE